MSEPISLIRRFVLFCFGLTIMIAGGVGADDAIPQPPELPQPIWQALLDGDSLVLRADLAQLLGLPEVVVILEESSASEMEFFMFRRYVSLLPSILPIADAASDLWNIDGDNTYYIHTTLSRDDIISEYRGWGWIPVDDEGCIGCLRQPLDAEDEAAILEMVEERRRAMEGDPPELVELRAAAESGDTAAEEYLKFIESSKEDAPFDPEEAAQEIRSEFEIQKYTMVPADSGWLALSVSWGEPRPIEMERPTEEEISEFRDFPFAAFLEEHPVDLLAVAIVFPGREEVLGSDPDSEDIETTDPYRARLEREFQELQIEARSLSGQGTADILDRLGNMLLRINETDGGLDIRLVAGIPGDPDDSLTADAIQIALGLLRMSAVSNSPELARELLDTTTSVSNDQLRVHVNLSHASLMDTIKRTLEKQRRTREIWKRMEEITAELANLDS